MINEDENWLRPFLWGEDMRVSRMRSWLRKMHRDTRGAMAVEKILIIALIALPIILVLIAFRDKLIGWFNDKSNDLQ